MTKEQVSGRTKAIGTLILTLVAPCGVLSGFDFFEPVRTAEASSGGVRPS